MLAETLDQVIARRTNELTGYQNAAYAARYSDLVAAVASKETAISPGSTTLTQVIARNHYKLLA